MNSHGSQLKMGSFCPSCGAALPSEEMLCKSCGYHKKLKRRMRIDVSAEDEDEPRGFQLWLQNSLTEGTSVQGVLLLACGLAMGLLVVGAITTFVAIGLWGLIFLPAIAVLAMILVSLAASGGRKQESGITGWAQRFIWDVLLYLLRLTRWQLCFWPPGTAKVKKVRDPAFDDDALAELEGLDQCRVLDLEPCNITDEGLGYLTAFPQLRFIVVRNSQVTDEAVRRLQRTIPAAWIWR